MMLVRETEDDPKFQAALKTQVKGIISKAEALKKEIGGGGQ
jgi:hypothetical protein